MSCSAHVRWCSRRPANSPGAAAQRCKSRGGSPAGEAVCRSLGWLCQRRCTSPAAQAVQPRGSHGPALAAAGVPRSATAVAGAVAPRCGSHEPWSGQVSGRPPTSLSPGLAVGSRANQPSTHLPLPLLLLDVGGHEDQVVPFRRRRAAAARRQRCLHSRRPAGPCGSSLNVSLGCKPILCRVLGLAVGLHIGAVDT